MTQPHKAAWAPLSQGSCHPMGATVQGVFVGVRGRIWRPLTVMSQGNVKYLVDDVCPHPPKRRETTRVPGMELIKEDFWVFAAVVYRHKVFKPEDITQVTKGQKQPPILPSIGVSSLSDSSRCCAACLRLDKKHFWACVNKEDATYAQLAHGILKPPPTPLLASKKSPIYPRAEKPHQTWPPSVSKAEHQHQRSTPPPPQSTVRAEHSPHTAPTHSPAGQSRNKTTTPDHHCSCTGPY